MDLVDAYPAFSRIVADRVGFLWVRDYRRRVWTVFDPEGRIHGQIETPPQLEVFEIGEDYLLGRVRDELGVEYVQLWSLSRDGGSVRVHNCNPT